MNVIVKKIAAALCMVAITVGLTACAHTDEVSASVSAEEKLRYEELKADAEAGLFILINKQNPIANTYCADDLAPISYYVEYRDAECRFMRSEAADQFNRMVEDAASEGVHFLMTTAYRSYNYQGILWWDAVEKYGSVEEANMIVAMPGQSEHQSGLAVDVSSEENGYELNEAFGDTVAGKWIASHAPDYGFIIRYPQNETEITGYYYEPWHLRYVGMTAAAEITSQGLVFEEYIEQLKNEGIIG